MFKIIALTATIIFSCFNFSFSSNKKLRVGDEAPAIKTHEWLKGNELPDGFLPKGKVYIVEFTATWCKPCIAAIPHLSALANKYRSQAELVSFFVQEPRGNDDSNGDFGHINRVRSFVKKKKKQMNYAIAIDALDKTMENNWLKATGSLAIPKTIVVDKEGHIAWIGSTSLHKTVDEVVNWVLSDQYNLSEAIKAYDKANPEDPFSYDGKKLLLVDNNGGKSDDFMFRSLIRKSDKYLRPYGPSEYISSVLWLDQSLKKETKSHIGRIQFVNKSIVDLYYLAYADTLSNLPYMKELGSNDYPDTLANPYFKRSYGKYWYEPVLEVEDPSKLEPLTWKGRKSPSFLDNKYDYSVQVPEEKATAGLIQKVMQRDLQNYFDYDVSVETREMPCWKITATSMAKTKTPGESPRGSWKVANGDSILVIKNYPTRNLLTTLATSFGYQYLDKGNMQPEDQLPFYNETALQEVDIIYPKNYKSDFHRLRKLLEKQGINVERSTRPMKVVVIRDPKE